MPGEVLMRSTRSFRIILNHLGVGKGGIRDWGLGQLFVCC